MPFWEKGLRVAFSKSKPSRQEQLRPSEQDDGGTLAAVVCKVRSLGRWRLAVQQAHLRGQLSRAEKVSVEERPSPHHHTHPCVTLLPQADCSCHTGGR